MVYKKGIPHYHGPDSVQLVLFFVGWTYSKRIQTCIYTWPHSDGEINSTEVFWDSTDIVPPSRAIKNYCNNGTRTSNRSTSISCVCVCGGTIPFGGPGTWSVHTFVDLEPNWPLDVWRSTLYRTGSFQTNPTVSYSKPFDSLAIPNQLVRLKVESILTYTLEN